MTAVDTVRATRAYRLHSSPESHAALTDAVRPAATATARGPQEDTPMPLSATPGDVD
jgi:hypothetical protein